MNTGHLLQLTLYKGYFVINSSTIVIILDPEF